MSNDFDEFCDIVGTETPEEKIERRFGIKMVTQKVTAKPRKLAATWTLETKEDLRKILPPGIRLKR